MQPQFLSIPQQEGGFKPYFPNYNFQYHQEDVKQPAIKQKDSYPVPKQKENYYYVSGSTGATPKPVVVFLDNGRRVIPTSRPVSQIRQKPLQEESKTSSTIVNFALVHDSKPSTSNTNNNNNKKHSSKNYPYYNSEDYRYTPSDEYEDDYNSKGARNYYDRVPDLLPYQKNNYDNVNPFSTSQFNIEEFFKGFDHYYEPQKDVATTEAAPPKSTEKVRTTTLSDYYYYDDYEEETEKPKIKHTTTQSDQIETNEKIETTTAPYGKKTVPKDDQYYYDEYEYDNESSKKPEETVVSSTETSTRPTTTTTPITTTFKIISSTTSPPVYTIRQRIRTTTLKTTNRPLLTTTDSDVRPDDLTTR